MTDKIIQLISEIIDTISCNKNKDTTRETLYSGDLLNDNDDIKWGILNDTKLYIYNYQCNKNDTACSSNQFIELKNVKSVKSITRNVENENKKKYKFGFLLDNNIKFFCDSMNKSMEWITHFQYIIANQTSSNEHVFEQRKHIQYNNIDCEFKRNDECITFKRIYCILHCYQLWIKEQSEIKNENKRECINRYLSDNEIKMQNILDDYHHCLNNNHFIDKPNEYIHRVAARHCRNTNFNDNRHDLMEKKEEIDSRKQLYFNYYLSQNVYLLQLLDCICCNLTKHQTDETNRIQRLQHKFIVKIDVIHAKQQYKANYDNFYFGIDFQYYDDYLYNANGCKKEQQFVCAHFNTLKEELLCNPIYKMSLFQFEDTYLKAIIFKQTKFIKSKTAANMGYINDAATIKSGDELTINHIICILTYTNYSKLQQEFKQTWWQSIQSNAESHTYIAHWSRYLFEIVKFYGDIMDIKQRVYVGLNNKLLFDQFQTYFNCPLSSSVKNDVAECFAAVNGVILELQRSHQYTKYFKAFMLSNFYDEHELFYCYSKLKIVNFRFKNHNKYYYIHCKAIDLFKRIFSGNLFVHKKK
eukprot:315818_1